jgi:hypothetical protein
VPAQILAAELNHVRRRGEAMAEMVAVPHRTVRNKRPTPKRGRQASSWILPQSRLTKAI